MLSQFEQHLKNTGRSQNTIRGYISDLKNCITRGITDKNMSYVNIDNLLNADLTTTTKSRIISSLKKYAKYLVYHQIIPEVPKKIAFLDLPKNTDNIPHMPSEKDLEKLLNHPDSEVAVAINLLYATGARIDSIASLRVEDIQDNSIIFRTTKGNKPYISVLPKQVSEKINQYLKETGKKSGWLFSKKDGSGITANCLRMRLKNKLGDAYHNPHSFRHLIATKLISNGAPVSVVKDFLNHQNITTTMRYVHLSEQIKKEQLSGVHPML